MSLFIELTTASLAVRKAILSLLNGSNLTLTRTEVQGEPTGVTADCVGQMCRVGPYDLTPPRTQAYDWYVADTVSSWRQINTLDAAAVAAAYATIASVALKAPISSPTFTGAPSAPTPDDSSNSTRLATTAFVKSLLSALGNNSFTPSATPPADHSKFWFDTTDGILAVWYGGEWLDVGGGGGGVTTAQALLALIGTAGTESKIGAEYLPDVRVAPLNEARSFQLSNPDVGVTVHEEPYALGIPRSWYYDTDENDVDITLSWNILGYDDQWVLRVRLLGSTIYLATNPAATDQNIFNQTGWTVITGAGQPVFARKAEHGQFIGQILRVVAPDYVLQFVDYAWTGQYWRAQDYKEASTTTPVSADVITGAPLVHETHHLLPAGTLAELTWNLPASTDAVVGQTKTLCSASAITALTVDAGGAVLYGAPLTTAAANVAYSYECISTASPGAWLRIR